MKKEKETKNVNIESGKKEICKTVNDNEMEEKEKTPPEEEDGKKENEKNPRSVRITHAGSWGYVKKAVFGGGGCPLYE